MGDGLWRVTLNRPDALNALSLALVQALAATADSLRERHDLRAVVLTGSGERAFCAGADLRERLGMTLEDNRRFSHEIHRAFSLWAELPMVTIAALNGVAFGGGLELALCCDLRLARPDVKVGLVEVRRAIIPGAGGTQRLARLIGLARAKEMILLGQQLTAHRALELGLLTAVGDPLEPQVRGLLSELEAAGPLALRAAKAAVDRGYDLGLAEGLWVERACYERTLLSEDRTEGLRAFNDKRTPRYTGR
jgi:enoyl-CoA hydratase/carnithine racemase